MVNKESNPKVLTGKVISNKMKKTIVVQIERTVKHPKYEKIIKRRAKFHAHDENELASIGQIVRIKESKPISKTKNWLLLDILS